MYSKRVPLSNIANTDRSVKYRYRDDNDCPTDPIKESTIRILQLFKNGIKETEYF